MGGVWGHVIWLPSDVTPRYIRSNDSRIVADYAF